MREEILRSLAYKLDIQDLSRGNNGWLNASCPFAPFVNEHKSDVDSSPSFGVMVNDNGHSSYYCFTCKRSGIISSLARQLGKFRGEDYGDVILQADQADADIVLPSWDEMVAANVVRLEATIKALNEDKYLTTYPPVIQSPVGRQYLVSRGIKKTGALKADLRYSESEQRIVFPVRGLDGKLYGFTGRTVLPPEQYPVYDSGKPFPKVRDFAGLKKERLILGADKWVQGKPVFIVEGLMGYASLLQQNADEIFNIGALMGSSLSKYQASILIQFGAAVYLMLDNDKAGDCGLFGPERDGAHSGNGAIDKLYDSLPVFVPEWPDNKDDPDQLTLDEVIDIRDNTELYTK